MGSGGAKGSGIGRGKGKGSGRGGNGRGCAVAVSCLLYIYALSLLITGIVCLMIPLSEHYRSPDYYQGWILFLGIGLTTLGPLMLLTAVISSIVLCATSDGNGGTVMPAGIVMSSPYGPYYGAPPPLMGCQPHQNQPPLYHQLRQGHPGCFPGQQGYNQAGMVSTCTSCGTSVPPNQALPTHQSTMSSGSFQAEAAARPTMETLKKSLNPF